jgi:hypothetical protein
MLSMMDQCPRLRWCLDVDLLSTAERERFPDWLACANKVTEIVAVTGWFCATDPTPLANAVRRVVGPRLRCYVQCHGKRRDAFDSLATAADLEQLIVQVNAGAGAGPARSVSARARGDAAQAVARDHDARWAAPPALDWA